VFFDNTLMSTISQEDNEVFISVITSPFYFLQGEMEVFLQDSTAVGAPMLCRGPETLNPIEIVSAFRSSLLFSDQDMGTTDVQKRVRASSAYEIEGSMRGIQSCFPLLAIGNVSTSAVLISTFTTEYGFIHLSFTGKGGSCVHLLVIKYLSKDFEPSVDGCQV